MVGLFLSPGIAFNVEIVLYTYPMQGYSKQEVWDMYLKLQKKFKLEVIANDELKKSNERLNNLLHVLNEDTGQILRANAGDGLSE